MDKVGYVYNRAAANLRAANVELIGLVINDLRNPFFTEFAASAQMAFARRGYATVIANTDEDPAIQAQVIAAMAEHWPLGLPDLAAYGDEAVAPSPSAAPAFPRSRPCARSTPAASYFPSPPRRRHRQPSRRRSPDPSRRPPHRLCRRTGEPPRHHRAHARIPRRLAEAGLEPVAFHGRPSRAFGRDIALRLVAERPDIEAAICFSDLVALGMLAGFAQAGAGSGRTSASSASTTSRNARSPGRSSPPSAATSRVSAANRPRPCSPGSRMARAPPKPVSRRWS